MLAKVKIDLANIQTPNLDTSPNTKKCMVGSDFIEKKIVEVKKYDEIGAFDGKQMSQK